MGNAIGAALITAVFWATVSAAPASGAARAAQFGRGYAAGLLVSVGFAVAALLVAIRDVRRPAAP
jgi:hypothetical protein